MKVFGDVTRLDELRFIEDGEEIVIKPNASTTYTATRTLSLPNADADDEITSNAAAQTLYNKTLSSPKIADAGTGDLIITSSNGALSTDRTLSFDVNDDDRSVSLSGDVSLAGAFSTSGAYDLTFTLTDDTSITLPETGTLATETYVDNAVGALEDADAINYDNSTSGLSATNVQDAIDEVEAGVGVNSGDISDLAGDLSGHESATSAHGVSGDIVGTSGAQVISNKTIEASNYVQQYDQNFVLYRYGDSSKEARFRLDDLDPSDNNSYYLPKTDGYLITEGSDSTLTNKTFDDELHLKELSSSPSSPSSGYKKLYPKIDGKLYTLDSDGNELPVGSGSGAGGVNYFINPDAEAGVNTGTMMTPESTLNEETSDVIRGNKSFLIGFTSDATTSDYIGFLQNDIDYADKNSVLALSFYTRLPSGSAYADGDVEAVLVKDGSDEINLGPLPANGRFYSIVPTDDSDNYELRLRVKTASKAIELIVDDLKFGPELLAQGVPQQGWTSYTPTFQGFGTVSGVDFKWSRKGEDLYLSGRFTTGNVTSDEAQVSLPPGCTIGTGVSNTLVKGIFRREVVGTNVTIGFALATDGDTFLNAGLHTQGNSSNPQTPATGSDVTNANNTQNIVIEAGPIPIREWIGASTNLTVATPVYASVSGTWDADASTTVIGPSGQAIEGTLTATRKKTVTLPRDIQPTDDIQIQVSADRIVWLPANGGSVSGIKIIPSVSSDGTTFSGISWDKTTGATNKIDVEFGQYIQLANDDSPAVNWPSTNAYWRVRVLPGVVNVPVPNAIKWQKKTCTTTLSDLSFSNLTPGKTYKLSYSIFLGQNQTSSNEKRYDYSITHDSNNVFGILRPRLQAVTHYLTSQGSSTIFTATGTDITFAQGTTTNMALESGYAVLEELPTHVETTAWT